MKMTGIPLSVSSALSWSHTSYAVHPRHIDIQQNQVRGIALRRQQCQLAAGNGADFIPAVLEHPGQHLEIGRGVVHDQDAGGLPSATFGLFWIQGRLAFSEMVAKICCTLPKSAGLTKW